MDNDIGYGVIRIDPNKPWERWNLAQPLIFVTLATLFEYGVGFHDLESDVSDGEKAHLRARSSRSCWRAAARSVEQVGQGLRGLSARSLSRSACPPAVCGGDGQPRRERRAEPVVVRRDLLWTLPRRRRDLSRRLRRERDARAVVPPAGPRLGELRVAGD
jgi:hypothetical protein